MNIRDLKNLLSKKKKAERYDYALTLQEVLEEQDIEVTVCSTCYKLIIKGYVLDGGREHYCSDKCLQEYISLDEFKKSYEDDDTENYWTEWE